MVRQAQLKKYALALKNTIYVWGANGQIITRDLVDRLHKAFGNDKYNKKYYDAKLKEGEGKKGADCSGAFAKISGYDTTASGYYSRCVEKGTIDTIPENKVCLVFKNSTKGGINHVGCYTGDGYVSEMASSKKNYQRKKLEGNGWDRWGMPDFISDPDTEFLDEDGSWGCDTTFKSQKVFGTKEDGKISNQKVSAKAFLPKASVKSWEFKKEGYEKGSSFFKALQQFLEVEGIYKGKFHGWCDKTTVVSLQQFLKDAGFFKGKANGYLNKATVKAWQQYINSLL